MTRKPWLLCVAAFFLAQPGVAQESGTDPGQPAAGDSTTSNTSNPAPEEAVSESESERSPSNIDPDTTADDQDRGLPGTGETGDADSTNEIQTLQPAEPTDPSQMSAADMLREFQTLYRSERLPEALDMAEQLVTYESRRQPPNSPMLIEPVLNLAEVRVATNQPEAALRAYDQAIDLIERDGGVYDERLIKPLVETGKLLSAAGQFDVATDMFLRAQHVTHRDDGVYSADQLEALDEMTENYMAAGDRISAYKAQSFSYAISYRSFQDQPRRIVSAMVKLAEFMQRVGRFDEARRQYLLAIKYTEDKLDADGIEMVTLMQGLGGIGMHEQMTARPHASSVSVSGFATPATPDLYGGRKEATNALVQTVELMEKYSNDVTPLERADAYLDLGDWYMLINKSQDSLQAYQQAWSLLAVQPNAEQLLGESFGQPKLIKYKKPALPRNGVPGAYENYDNTYVELRFDVMADGSVRDVVIVDANTPVALQNDMRRAVTMSMYRPKFVDGQPVSSDGVRLRETFSGTSWEAAN